MLTLHVEADSYDKLVKDCWAALGLQLKGSVVPEAAPAEPTGPPETKRSPGRPKKEAIPETAAPAPPTSSPPVPKDKPTAPLTLESVRQALQAYAEKAAGGKDTTVGIMKAREVLAEFNSVKGVPCQKISEVQDKDYAGVLAACAA